MLDRCSTKEFAPSQKSEAPLVSNKVDSGCAKKVSVPEKKSRSEPASKFTDYTIDGVSFRVFMNPVEWKPKIRPKLPVCDEGESKVQ